ncbi:hypothetical protein QYE76_056284 [Lolium multiflorum]|uniref:Dirigent protein n=1 Tax=Lolium multiflorum TaxID=4521 RepID=A0AAD8WQ98_LOLMU|nr:hypothetical protein QYE76_056284 [Lolium multiflorum]
MQLLQVLVSSAFLLVEAAAARKTMTTHIKFYMHDTVTVVPSSPAMAVRAARGVTPLPVDPAIRFGDMFVIDDPLADGPNAASPAIGTVQGFYILASRTDFALMLTVNMVFTAGQHHRRARKGRHPRPRHSDSYKDIEKLIDLSWTKSEAGGGSNSLAA